MLIYGDGNSPADAGTALLGRGILDTVQAGSSAEPEVPIQRSPETGPDVITEMSFEREYRRLCLLGNPGVVRIF